MKGTVLIIFLLVLCGSACGSRGIPGSDLARINDTAAYISGLDMSRYSPYYPYLKYWEYADYKKSIDAAWNIYKKREIDNIIRWRAEQPGPAAVPVVFYPFSGPDLINLLAFFPDAERYIMAGLEVPGSVPDPGSMGRDKNFAELRALQAALHTEMNLNYFRTLEMRKEFNAAAFNNVICIMLFFLVRTDHEVLDLRNVILNEQGVVEPARNPGTSQAWGIEITFRKKRFYQGSKTAYYFKTDLSNAGLKSSHFARFIKKQGRWNTFMKSAAYLPGLNSFSAIRSIILEQSDYILEDDACIPIRFFSRDTWSASFFGRYRVLKMFTKFFQPDLDAMMKKESHGPLTFSFGYGYTPEESHLIIMQRR